MDQVKNNLPDGDTWADWPKEMTNKYWIASDGKEIKDEKLAIEHQFFLRFKAWGAARPIDPKWAHNPAYILKWIYPNRRELRAFLNKLAELRPEWRPK